MMDRPVIFGTGLSSAIGQALLARLTSRYQVVALGRTPMGMGDTVFIEADFRRPLATWRPTVESWLHSSKPEVVGFVHLAGVVYSDALEATTEDEWRSMVDVNLSAALGLGQLLSSWFSSGGSVVLVGSVDAQYSSQAGRAAGYGASKAGLKGLMRHWAAEWGKRNIRVNGIAPGALTVGMSVQDHAIEASLRQRIALQRLGRADEVAAVIDFLLSPAASYLTGAWIPVDGGLNLSY